MHTQVTKDAFSGQKIFVGLDVHKKDFKVSVMAGAVLYKTFSSPPDGQKVLSFLQHNFPGAEYYSAYEAGFSGFWLHKQLMELGVNSIVVNQQIYLQRIKNAGRKKIKETVVSWPKIFKRAS